MESTRGGDKLLVEQSESSVSSPPPPTDDSFTDISNDFDLPQVDFKGMTKIQQPGANIYFCRSF